VVMLHNLWLVTNISVNIVSRVSLAQGECGLLLYKIGLSGRCVVVELLSFG